MSSRKGNGCISVVHTETVKRKNAKSAAGFSGKNGSKTRSRSSSSTRKVPHLPSKPVRIKVHIPVPAVDLCASCLKDGPTAAIRCARCRPLLRFAAELYAAVIWHFQQCEPCRRRGALPLPPVCSRIVRLEAEERAAKR
jgi:hypothetical protein